MSLDELEKAAEAPQNPVELQKDVVRRHWKEYTIRDAIWHVLDAWREVMPNCIRGAWKKLCPDLAVDFGGFDLSEELSREHLKCLKLARKVGLDEVEEDNMDSLLESIGEELSMEDLEDLVKQRCQLEEEVEAGQHPTTPPRKEMTIEVLQDLFGSVHTMLDKMETMDPDFERSGLKRRQILDVVAFYNNLLQKRRRTAMQSILNRFFKKKSSTPDASTNSEEPQPGTSTGGYTSPVVSPSSPPLPSLLQSSSSSSDVDNPAAI